MGIFASCCKPSGPDVVTPDVEIRRRQQIEAAERRRAEEATRGGIKNATAEKLRRAQEREDEREKRERELAQQGGPALKWTTS